MRDVSGGRHGPRALVAGAVLAAAVAGAPSAFATGGGQGHTEHGNGKGVGHAQHAHDPAPASQSQTPPQSSGAKKAGNSAGRAKAQRSAPPPRKAAPPKQSSSGTKTRTRTRSSSSKAARPQRRNTGAKAKGANASQTRSSTPKKHGHDKVWICHATGSTTNPFVRIRPASPSHPQAHDRHQHDEDIIPAPNGECPGQTTSSPRTDVPGGPVRSRGWETTLSGARTAGAASGTTPPASTVITRPLPAGSEQTVLGETGTTTPGGAGDDRAGVLAAADAPVTPARAGDDDGLPFTGLEWWLLALVGLFAMTTGLGLRLATRPGR